ncbi:coiled-coil domain-containing protein SCD2-like isoform X2 [Macadamia integrifolia]|uniref:coiled-coil domain-containing protein SCD2-like isoform X2 n=1 Tax=Macadamia integrifolia TaxID=60698 RepID=UPI001C4F5F1F|nr:coiled-coil domain-containing protein SCD2-like isoform X2 [Macadamia integrifolia]
MDTERTRSTVYVGLKRNSSTSGSTASSMSESAGVDFRRPQNSTTKAAAQKLAQVMAHRQTEYDDNDEDDDDDDLSLDYNPTGSIVLASRSRMWSSSPALGCNYLEQTPSSHFLSASRSSLAINSAARFTSVGQSSFAANSVKQPSSAHSASAARPFQVAKTVPMVPSSIQLSLRPPTFVSPSDPSTDHQRDRRPSVDLGSSNLRETGNLPSIFALQDELDMLQEENESIIEKLQLAEERCVEAEARARQFEEQVASVGEGLSFEARLLSRREAYLLQREGALKDAEQTHDVKNVQVSTLRLEAETAKDEAESSLEQLHEAEYEIKSLQTLTQRLILSQEEMEEVVLKRCWLSRHWNLCFQYGIHAEIASEKYEFWSSLAPLPLEVVLSAGQKAKEESSVEKNDVEERDKDPRDLNELSGEGNIESMLLVEKGMRELASLKVEDAVMLAMAQHRLPHLLKYDQRVSDDLKLTVDNQLLLEACELSEEESQDVAFKQAWLIYFWRRAKNHGLEQDITDERLQFWIINSTRSPTPYDVVDVERGLMELRKLGIETRLWEESRRVIDPGFSHSKISFDSYL